MGAPLPSMKRKPKVLKPIISKQASKDARKVVRAVKQTKSQAKQVNKTIKSIGRALAKIKKAVKKKNPKSPKKSISKPTPKVKLKRADLPSVIKLRNIKQLQGKSWNQIVSDRATLAKLNKLKRADEYFIGSVFGNQTHKFFRTAEELVDQLNVYVDTYAGDEQKMIETFTIAALGGSPTDYAREVDTRIRENKERALSERAELGVKYGKTTQAGKTKTFRDFAKDAERAANEAKQAELQKQSVIDSLLERVAKLERALGGATKNNRKKGTSKHGGSKVSAKQKGKSTVKKAPKKSIKKASKKNASKRSTKSVPSGRASKAKGSSAKSKRAVGGRGKATGKAKAKNAAKAKPKTGATKRTSKLVTKKPINRRK